MELRTIYTAEKAIPVTAEDAALLVNLLDADGTDHGFVLEVQGGPVNVTAYLSGEGDIELLPAEFLRAMGSAILAAGLPFLSFGFACTSSRLAPGSHGGGDFRLMPDGRVAYPVSVW